MGLHLGRPSDGALRARLDRCRDESLTYEAPGCSLRDETPSGMRRQQWTTLVEGSAAFERGVTALREWGVHRSAGLVVAVDGPIAVGTNVAMSAPLPVGYVDATCRVVAVIDEENRFAFAYGTLPTHPERGEESFIVSKMDAGARFDISSVSAPSHPLARLVPPVARRLQAAATDRYLDAMRRLAANPT